MSAIRIPLQFALSAYRNGYELPLALLLRSFRPALTSSIVDDPNSELVRALLRSIASRAVAMRDEQILELLPCVAPSESFVEATIQAACEGWKPGYAILRGRQKDRPVLGIPLEAAYLVDDSSAYDRSRPAARIREDVREFWEWVRATGIPTDDAIDFLSHAHLEWAVDYALGLDPNSGTD